MVENLINFVFNLIYFFVGMVVHVVIAFTLAMLSIAMLFVLVAPFGLLMYLIGG